MKDLKFYRFTIDTVSGDTPFYTVSFNYTSSDSGSGSITGLCCESADAVMTCVKQMLNNEWPGG